jgi:hypothetical protein
MRWIVVSLLIVFGPILFGSLLVGLFVQAWAPFWFGQQQTLPITLISGGGVTGDDIGNIPLAPILGPQPIVSDHQRYLLALGAGFSLDEALTATAISIAEDGGGDPAALSPKNKNGTFDLGLLQINSSWWPQCGGQAALVVPANNFACGHHVYTLQGWCAWSTYDARCGPGHTGSYSAYLSRARAAAFD